MNPIPKKFNADHPFMYMIVQVVNDSATSDHMQIPLFIGDIKNWKTNGKL